MKTLDKKLFIGLKYLVILIPLFITVFNLGKAYFISHQIAKVYATEQNENVWQYRDNQIDELDGGTLTDEYLTNVVYGDYDIVNHFKSAVGEVSNYLPKVKIIISGTSIYTDPITLAMGKASYTNVFASVNSWNSYKSSTQGTITQYLYYVVIVELIWVLIVLFKWFIGFSYGLFERKKDL